MSSGFKIGLVVKFDWIEWECDISELLAIETASFEFPWTEQDFTRCRWQRTIMGMVVKCHNAIVGYMIYELSKRRLHLLNFAVHPDFRRRGIGTQMAEKLISKLSQHLRQWITLEVRECNLPAQIFWRSRGFRAVTVLRGFYKETPEDAYVMTYRFRSQPEAHEPFCR